MAPLVISKTGTRLRGVPNVDESTASQARLPQVMRLDLAETMLQDLLKTVRMGGPSVQLSFGETPVRIHCSIITSPIHSFDY